MMKKGLLILCFIMIFTDAFSQRIPFGFWNRGQRDTVLLSAPTLKSPVDGATDVDQEPILDWDGVIYATNYVIQLSADTGFSSIAWEHDTTSSKAGVTLGLARGTEWYWRVLAYNQFDTSDWSGAWSFTVTTGPPLTAPTLKLPTDGTTGTIQSPTLVWDAVINADNYTVELSNSTSFASPYWLKNVENTSAIIDSVLDYSTTWYWRATAYNDFDTSEASDTFSFTILSSPLTAPTLLTPTDGAIDQTQSPYLTWSRVDSAGFYAVQISQSEMFSEIPWNINTFDTIQQITAGLLEGTQWYWRVRSINSDTSAWSEVFTFKVTEGTPTARAYYLDATNGKDEYNGRSTDQPWKSIVNLNTRTLLPGDSILFKGGETFTGDIYNYLTHDDTTKAVLYSSYGTGKAIIDLGETNTVGIKLTIANHVKVNISNIKITGNYDPVTETGGAATQRGIWVITAGVISPITNNKISQVNINHCEVSYLKNGGISVVPYDYGRTITCHIDSNLVHNLGWYGISIIYNWHSNSRIYGNTIRDLYGISSSDYVGAISTDLSKDIAVERNLIYNIGYNSAYSGLGIVTSASKNIRIRYNEIYGIINNSHYDGEAIDLENGSDSCLVEYNYIHNTGGVGVLISRSGSEFTLNQNLLPYVSERGSVDSTTGDYNVVRYNVIKNWGRSFNDLKGFAGIDMSAGVRYPISQGEGVDTAMGNQIYNNTLVFSGNGQGNVGIALKGHSIGTEIFNNLVVCDSLALMWVDSLTTKRNTFIQNNMFYDRQGNNFFYNITTATSYFNLKGWSGATGYDTAIYKYNPLLINTFNLSGDTLGNPFAIETSLSKYIPVSASMVIENGATSTGYVFGSPSTDIRGLTPITNSKYSIGAIMDTSTTGHIYQEETRIWLGRHDTTQTLSQNLVKDSLIKFMKEDTLLSKLDLFYIFANLDSYSANINIVRDTFDITPTNSPLFTTQQGYTGNGTNAYLQTKWIPSTSAVNFTLNNASSIIYVNTESADNGYLYGGTNGTNFIEFNSRNNSNNLIGRLNQNTGITISNLISKGIFTLSRTGSSVMKIYANDTLLSNGTTTSTALLSTYQLYLLGRNFSGGVSSPPSSRQISMFATGSAMTDLQQHRFTDNYEWYLTAIGDHKKPIKPILASPNNADTGVALDVTFQWEDLNNARYYQLQTSYLSNFSSLTGDVYVYDTNLYVAGTIDTGLGYAPITLLNNKVYYWRVRGVNREDTSGNGKWSDINSFYTPSTYETESTALFARMTYVPSDERKYLMDSLVKYLKGDTVWQETDLLYMFAAVDTGNAKFNWINSSYTIVNSGTTKAAFTTEKGYRSDGITGHLRTNWTPSTHGVSFTLNNGSYSIYSQDNIAENTYIIGANNTGTLRKTQLNPRTSANEIQSTINQDGWSNASNSNSQGFFTISRDSAGGYNIYRNSTLISTRSEVSTGLPTVPLAILGVNFNGTYTNFSTRQISFVRVGAKLSAYRENKFARRIEWYLNRISAYNFVPSAPILITPHDTATGVSETPNIDWDNVGADYYQIEIDDLPAFATPEYTANTAGSEVLSTVFEATPVFTAGLTYYWRVRGVNANGTGAWSSTYSFTIAP